MINKVNERKEWVFLFEIKKMNKKKLPVNKLELRLKLYIAIILLQLSGRVPWNNSIKRSKWEKKEEIKIIHTQLKTNLPIILL